MAQILAEMTRQRAMQHLTGTGTTEEGNGIEKIFSQTLYESRTTHYCSLVDGNRAIEMPEDA